MARHYATHAWNPSGGYCAQAYLAPFSLGAERNLHNERFNFRGHSHHGHRCREWRVAPHFDSSPSVRLHFRTRLRFGHSRTSWLLQGNGNRHVHGSSRWHRHASTSSGRQPRSWHRCLDDHNHGYHRGTLPHREWNRPRPVLRWFLHASAPKR